jgi:hypothetical protein
MYKLQVNQYDTMNKLKNLLDSIINQEDRDLDLVIAEKQAENPSWFAGVSAPASRKQADCIGSLINQARLRDDKEILFGPRNGGPTLIHFMHTDYVYRIKKINRYAVLVQKGRLPEQQFERYFSKAAQIYRVAASL